MDKAVIRLIDENGKYVEYNILFTFRCEELDKDYVAFTKEEQEYDKDGNTLIYIAYYNPNSSLTDLKIVENEDELKMAYEVLEQVIQSEKENE